MARPCGRALAKYSGFGLKEGTLIEMMGKPPLAPRQGSALSEAWFPYARASARITFKVGVAGWDTCPLRFSLALQAFFS